jgi:pimeloyl-ACP methyl ester carboxylesterase
VTASESPARCELLRSPSATPAATVVLIPGLDGTALLFYRQVPLLLRRFDVLLLPLPDDSTCTMEGLVEHVRGAVEARVQGAVILCGESFGGALALSTALGSPPWLRGLVLVNSFARVPQQLRLRLGIAGLRLFPWGAMPLARRLTEARLHSPHARAEDLREFRARVRRIGRAGYLRRLEILRGYDARASLSRIAVPVLLLAGDRDRLLPSVREARFMAERMPRATLRVLEGFGHVCLINHDLDLLAELGPWFERVRAGDTAAAAERERPVTVTDRGAPRSPA